jgi:uncharacterized protein YpmS
MTNKKDKEYKKLKKEFFIYLTLFVIFIAVSFIFKIQEEKDNEKLDSYGQVTEGMIYSRRETTKGFIIKYAYFAEGEKYDDVTNTRNEHINVKDIFEVEYLPGNPDINRINLDKKITKYK